MFTGIIQTTGRIEKINPHSVQIKAPEILKELKIGSSVAVDGVCLTVKKKEGNSFEADIMPITFERSAFGQKKKGDLVNLELAMMATSRFEGHIVSGHAEGVAELIQMKIVDNAYHLTFSIPHELSRYVIPTGSIALNGISLTVIDIQNDQFTVGIIPHTWDYTNLHTLTVGDTVTIETDILAKYAEKLTSGNSTLAL